MANIKFTNFARSKLTVGITTGSTTITITGASGALFPALTAGQYFYATLENAALAREIVKVTARTGDSLTVTRAQDNTTALAWNAGDTFALRFNAAAITDAMAAAAGPFALAGANSDITSLSGLTTALSILQGGTGATTAAAAPFALKGANSDITSLSGLTTPLSVAQGGTGLTAGVSSKIQSISASVAASALTITAGVLALDFRSATLTSGTVTTVSGTPANLVVPSTATLGTVSAQQSRLVVLALNNAGTIELAVVNISGGNDLTETGVISTTAISVTANAANVIYSTTARTGVAYRVVGYIESTQTTAGTWAAAPSTIQGYGGQALAAMSSLGYGQTWQNVTGSRALATTYYNTTGKPITVSVYLINDFDTTPQITINGELLYLARLNVAGGGGAGSAIVPPGHSYMVNVGLGTPTLIAWNELR
jgi:hypothetical protein